MRAFRGRSTRPDKLTDRPDFALVGILRIPQQQGSPGAAIVRRIGYALIALAVAVLVVYLGRGSYRDVQGQQLSLLDCFYYATVSLSTTGYGDITPITAQARLVNILVITPLRVFFLIVLVGTTLSALTESSRQTLKIRRRRRRTRNHTIVVGFGTKGRAAIAAMRGEGAHLSDIVVVDTDPAAIDLASRHGLVTVHGSATQTDILRLAGMHHASSIVIATDRDDTAVLVTLTAHEIAPQANIVASIREADHAHSLRRSGATTVIVSSETAGRLLGVATHTPNAVDIVEDLLTPETGYAIVERNPEPDEIGESPQHLSDLVLGIVRNGQLLRKGTPGAGTITPSDTLLCISSVSE